MAEGMSQTLADACLGEADAYTFVQLHVGAPGAAGTANIANETGRQQATWSAPAAGPVANSRGITTTADLVWTGVSGAEDYTHYTIWTLTSAGAFGHSGTVTANAVLVGDTFRIPAGDLDVYYPVAS